jgi:hypothetical protein
MIVVIVAGQHTEYKGRFITCLNIPFAQVDLPARKSEAVVTEQLNKSFGFMKLIEPGA